MPIKINDLTLPKEKLEKEYQVVNVTRWQKDGEILGWSYECILPKLRYEKISVKVKSETPIISSGRAYPTRFSHGYIYQFGDCTLGPLKRSIC